MLREIERRGRSRLPAVIDFLGMTITRRVSQIRMRDHVASDENPSLEYVSGISIGARSLGRVTCWLEYLTRRSSGGNTLHCMVGKS
jgi:hypothetical protein